jgi:tetratricopeptide (TPR) repeat protein
MRVIMNWKDYENEICDHFRNEYPDATVTHNATLHGRYSFTDRQVDILIEDYIAGNRFVIIIDGKFFSKKIDVKCVESFIGMVNDIGAHKSLMITSKGYSKAAIQRAYNDPIDIELDILNFADLDKHQGFVAMPHAGHTGVVLPAPFGWVVDAKPEDQALCCYLYQRGLSIKEAKKRFEFMYVNFWKKTIDINTIDELIEFQNARIMASNPDAKLNIINTINRKDAKTTIREADIPRYHGLEITGYVDFKNCIFFCVLLTRKEFRNKNLRKLEYILGKIIPLNIKFDNEKRIEKALTELKSITDSKARANLREKLSRWYLEMNDLNNAINVLEEIIIEFPSHYSASKRLLELRKKEHNKHKLKKELDRYFNLDPKNPTIYNDIIEIFQNDIKYIYDFLIKKVKEYKDKHVIANIYFYLSQISPDNFEAIDFLDKARKLFEEIFKKDHYIFRTIDALSKSIKESGRTVVSNLDK